MTDGNKKLRDRIAAVVAERYRTDPINTVEGWSVLLADAVIADLHLSVTGGVIVGCLHE